ncbi:MULTISPECIES: DUF302 domain-containing protein [Vibrio]|uniref:DUF302 domain-containing protein n=3 Tax=Vibrio cyclitrophicus TaxID=47951 RepID=A0A7Z1MLH7_9VIBR|nr:MULTISPECIES: DUF302 domain-containing protein [Vibrio]KNH12750.1 membrane protein [Vibrio lentus]MBY7660192.1 DUF302 domain-containing protein [Vibrio atlanticus]ERM60886.1 putative inner membrane or exported protein [Vibrio cyclitrophicus FF75]KAA8600289.1 putative inner membrane or exported protein [Vibrio cyclitrophicus]MBE8556392.1 DUF302 domain-containing protein [Vibrio sp. OPT24]|tara:strand:+ start:609 stop:1061 length:453 start_codon:yes stop_codon:yes gene_type:complete
MKKLLSLGAVLLAASFSVAASDGLIKYQSNYSVKETADRFESIAKSKGLTLFARIDHQKNASSVDLELRPTEVIIFGNPKVGTPLMQCQQDVAIDLPQKVLVTEDSNKKVWLSYNDPNYLMERHAINGCDEVIKKISGVLSKLSEATIAK